MTVEEQLSHLILMMGNLGNRIDGMEENMNSRFDRLEEKVDSLVEKVDKLEEKVDNLEEKVDKLEEKVDKLEEKVDKLEEGQFELKQNMAVLIEAQTALGNQEQRHYKELSARMDNLERIQKEQCYDIIKLRAAQ